jgi:pimeloyl-ACP methyl ester carboxylesterase
MNTTIALQRFLGAAVNFMSAVFLSILLYISVSNIARAADYIQIPGSPVPGQLVDVGTHKLHIYCQGQGSPTVIVDTGLGEISLEWKHVQEGLVGNSRVCLYDRAGYGWSETGPLPRTSSYIADELYTLLTRANIEGPYILVGHSFGGFNMQVFASRYPELTAGIVLVDSSHPGQYERFMAAPIKVKTAPDNTSGSRNFRFSMPKVNPKVPEEVRDDVLAMLLKHPMQMAMGNEYYDYRQSAAEVIATGELPPVPLLVLSRGKRVYPHNRRGDLMEILWSTLQAELVERSPKTAHVIANESGHFIHLDQPQLVIDSVALIVDIAKFKSLFKGRIQDDNLIPRPAWYAFNDATWRSDWLSTRRAQGPNFPSQNGHQQLGFMADTVDLFWEENQFPTITAELHD